jgi:hypothetical protein
MRKFKTGAIRNSDELKNDYEGFLDPLVIEAFGDYMTKHRVVEGQIRASDNWQKGFGEDHLGVCIKSAWRHFLDWWLEHRGFKSRESLDDAICGLLFNLMAYYSKILRDRQVK